MLAACRENISRAQQKYCQCVTLRLLVVGGDGDGLEFAGACAHFGLQLPSPNSDTEMMKSNMSGGSRTHLKRTSPGQYDLEPRLQRSEARLAGWRLTGGWSSSMEARSLVSMCSSSPCTTRISSWLSCPRRSVRPCRPSHPGTRRLATTHTSTAGTHPGEGEMLLDIF